MLSGVLLVLGGLLALVVVLLAVPVGLSWQVAWPAEAGNRVELHWLFGLVRVKLPVAKSAKAPKESAPDRPERPDKAGAGGGTRALRAFRDTPFRRRLIRYLRDMWTLVEKDDVRVRLRFGLDDPAATGQLWGLLGPLAAVLGSFERIAVRIEPEFADEAFDLDSSGAVRFVPVRMLGATLALGFSRDVWRGVRLMRAG